MLKRTCYLVLFFLLAVSSPYSQDEPRQDKRSLLQSHPELRKLSYSQRIEKPKELSSDAKQSLEARGFKVLELAPKLVSPRKDSLEADKEVIRINVSLNLNSSGVRPIYVNTPKHSSSVQAATDTIMTDGFEGDFPGTKWQRSGDPTWGNTNYQKHSGSYSVWCAKDSSRGMQPGQSYPNNCRSMMIYGPFDLTDVNYAQLKFWYWLDTEYEKDWFYFMASTDGSNFQGIGVSGETGGWEEEMLHLLGNVTSRSQIWVAFLLESDTNATSDKGVFVDDVVLTKRQVAGTPIAGSLSGTLSRRGNPYVAVGDVGVVEGDSLKIDPGVEIRFEKGYEFVVVGLLKAIGTPSDSILFTSNKANPAPGDWMGIGLYSENGNELTYCSIKFGTAGIYYEHDPKISNCFISNSKTAGISVYGSGRISFNTIVNNASGISIQWPGEGTYINNNIIAHNSHHGIYSWFTFFWALNNVISDNGSSGVTVTSRWDWWVWETSVIKGNLIKDNLDGIRCSGATPFVDIVNNIIVGNDSSGVDISNLAGGWVEVFQGNIINNCFVRNANGIKCGRMEESRALNNIFYENTKSGIYFKQSSYENRISFSNFHKNASDFKGFVNDSLGVLVKTNANGDSTDTYFNIFADPLFVNSEAGNFHLRYTEAGFPKNSPCRDAGNSNVFYNDAVDGTSNDMGAYGGCGLMPSFISYEFDELPVNFSKTTVFKLKNDRPDSFAIKNLSLSDDVNFSISKVESMILPPFGETEITLEFCPKTVGSFSTYLVFESDDFYGSDSAKINFQGKGFHGTAVKGGFVNGTWTESSSPYMIYGPIEVSKNDSLIIEPGVKVIFDVNVSELGLRVSGKLIAVGTKESPITFSEHHKRQGLWSGIKLYKECFALLKFCTIEHASHGINVFSSSVRLDNCTIKNCGDRTLDEDWGALKINYGWSWPPRPLITPIITNCIIANNYSVYGGGIYCSSNAAPRIENNIIARNEATEGGGIMLRGASPMSPIIINNTIVDNKASYYGGGVYAADTLGVFENNILWNNIALRDSQISLHASATATVTFSNIQGGWLGEGNIDADPLFIDPANGDYHLQPNSPCIDKGNPDPQYNDPEDPNNLGHALYPAMGSVRNDMGAYGGPSAAGWMVVTAVESKPEGATNLPKSYALSQNYPNPFNPVTTIKYQLPKSTGISLAIYNVLGQLVRTLVDEKQPAGYYSIRWDGTDDSGRPVASGVYLYILRTKEFLKTRKLAIIR